ncbi:DNA-directed RNA polymerase subunit alpha C-terminal domain-containing protein [Actinomadura alba]|uniref:RNA polymerase alpha subunit C-terminal domain-containing protein n=1 Tax=Actinomadura alba TaxID=406431 RepID=A0ABR7LHG0_9ACTN|nr:DNA-directed RNA polymerase subunit alpha C-terminal domain-containing protein [Actinomadura alba]MBC6464299.1 hypothetical protein [Actinomadura alba]
MPEPTDRPQFKPGDKVRAIVDGDVVRVVTEGHDSDVRPVIQLIVTQSNGTMFYTTLPLNWEGVTVEPLTETPEPAAPAESFPTPDPDQSIHALRLSTRAFNILWRAKILTVGDLTSRTEDDLMDLRNMGVRSHAEVLTALAARGLALKEAGS